jgi:hypothetical protein
MRHASAGHRYWFLLEEVQGSLSVVAYVYFDFKKGIGTYIVHILCQSSGWNATSALTAIAVEKAARNNMTLVFLNFTGIHLDRIYRRCGFASPPAEFAAALDQFKDPVHDQLLVKILESKTVVPKVAANGTKRRAIGPRCVVVGYAAPATADASDALLSDALLSAAPTAASSPAVAEFASPGDRGGAHRKRGRDPEPQEDTTVLDAAKRVWGAVARLSALCAQGAQGARGALGSPF